MHPLLESLRGAVPDTCENYWHLGSVSGEPTEQNLQARESAPRPSRATGSATSASCKSSSRRPTSRHCGKSVRQRWYSARSNCAGLPTTCRRACRSHPTAGVTTRGRQCHTSVAGGSCTCAPRNSTKSAYSTGTGGGCDPATRARNPLAWSRPIALITNFGVLKRSFSFRRKLRFRTPSFEAELQRWAEAALPHSNRSRKLRSAPCASGLRQAEAALPHSKF
jgi:hypothetical protein